MKETGGIHIELYIYNVNSLEEPIEHEEWREVLPAGRWEKIVRFTHTKDRRLGAGAGLLLRYVFCEHGVRSSSDSFFYGRHGKPLHNEICFNLSHSGEYVICAVSKKEVGCDIQSIRPYNAKLMKKCYSKNECNYVLNGKNEEQKNANYIRIWTLKESYLKKTGIGLGKDLSHIAFDLTGDPKVMEDGIKQKVLFSECELKGHGLGTGYDFEKYRIAVCGEEPLTKIREVFDLENDFRLFPCK